MNRPDLIRFQPRRLCRSRRGGFTLIEVLVAVTLTLVMMAAVVQIFAVVGKSINNSRSTLEMSERIRAVASRLKLDLEGVTADMTPPGRPEEGKGYFEYIEGPIGPVDPTLLPPGNNTDEPGNPIDSTVGDRDDILQFTTRSRGEPFVGRGLVICDLGTLWGRGLLGPCDRYTTIAKSQVAEVSWFLRGTTLYRRVLLVSPSFDADIRTGSPDTREAEVPSKGIYLSQYRSDAGRVMGYYNNYDLSVHWDDNANRVGITGGVPDLSGGAGRVVCNTLADLTRRECRYAHPPKWNFPYALHDSVGWRQLGLPTLQECSHWAWPFPIDGTTPTLNNVISDGTLFDAWVNQYPLNDVNKETGAASPPATLANPVPPNGVGWPLRTPSLPTETDAPRYIGPRVAEDVILTNVLSFDVKAWDPEAPIFLQTVGTNTFSVAPGDTQYPSTLHLYNSGGGGAPVIASRGAYADLGYGYDYTTNPPTPAVASTFSQIDRCALWRVINIGSETINTVPRMFDTWSTHYEHDGVDQDGIAGIDQGTNGFDDNISGTPDGVVDDPSELEAPPPYSAPLRGIQIKIRVFDPDSQKVREVTVRHDFMNR